MRASVVIPARNGAGALPRLLASLDAQTAGDFEVIVVDNASTDGTAAVAARLGARVVAEPQPGRARARNAGVAAAVASGSRSSMPNARRSQGGSRRCCVAWSTRRWSRARCSCRRPRPPGLLERFDVMWRASISASTWSATDGRSRRTWG